VPDVRDVACIEEIVVLGEEKILLVGVVLLLLYKSIIGKSEGWYQLRKSVEALCCWLWRCFVGTALVCGDNDN
jgi:hypothetical protein